MGKKTQEKADETKKTTNQNEAEMTPEERAAAEAKFLERVRGLIGVARKKKNILEYQEISDYFADLQLNEDQFDKLLELLEQDCTQSAAQLAAQAGMTEEQVKAEMARLEQDGTILGYQAIIDWDRVKRENVTALIEVKVVPQSIDGFDRIAERIYQYDEVESVYLMSGGYDLQLVIKGQTFQEIALFVAKRLSPLDDVLSTATHFVLRTYKKEGRLYQDEEIDERECTVL